MPEFIIVLALIFAGFEYQDSYLQLFATHRALRELSLKLYPINGNVGTPVGDPAYHTYQEQIKRRRSILFRMYVILAFICMTSGGIILVACSSVVH